MKTRSASNLTNSNPVRARKMPRFKQKWDRVTAHYAERIQRNRDLVAREKEALHNWQMAKQHESQRISDVIELCGKQASPGNSAMTAGAGAGATGGSALASPPLTDGSRRS